MNFANTITIHRILRIAAAALMAVLVYPIQAQSKTEKEAADLKYKDKFLLVNRDGIFVGILSEGLMCSKPGVTTTNGINDVGDVQLINPFHCGTEPIHKGEVLEILAVRLTKDYLSLDIENLSPHSITRGIGAFAHPSMERGKASIVIRAGKNGEAIPVPLMRLSLNGSCFWMERILRMPFGSEILHPVYSWLR